MGPAGEAGEGAGASSRRRRRRTRPGRTLLGFLVFYTIAFSALALAGYGVAHFASRSPERPGEIVATIFFYAALGAITIMTVFLVASRTAQTPDPWWLASLGFVSGVLAAAYVRLKYLVGR